jgi:predicted dehydrogenase
MSRRSFIKHAGLLSGGLLLHNSFLNAFASVGSADKINIGIIGCGDRGKGLMLVMKELQESFNITAICDVLDFRMKEALTTAGSSKVQTYTDYRRLLDDKTIHAVAIATPLNMHYAIATDALKAGKQVYLEKTMTYNIDQAKDLVKLTKKYPGQTLQVGHQYRYTPLYFKVKEMIEKGYLRKVTQVDCRWDRNWNWKRPVPDPSLERQINWRMYKEYSGGLPAELLSHQMDFINWAFQTHPNEVLGTGGIDFYKDGRETYDNVQVMFRYDKEGMIGNFGSTCGNARDGYLFKLKGTKGTVSLLMHEGIYYPEAQTKKELETVDGVTGSTKITWNKEGGIPILKEPTKDGTWYALKEFYNCITTKQQPVSNVITGATTAVCVHLANKAIYDGTIEKWKPAYDFS